MPATDAPILVTGATGFVASRIVEQLPWADAAWHGPPLSKNDLRRRGRVGATALELVELTCSPRAHSTRRRDAACPVHRQLAR